MTNVLADNLKEQATFARTENGAVAYDVNTLSPLVKFFYKISNNRSDVMMHLKTTARTEKGCRYGTFQTKLSKEFCTMYTKLPYGEKLLALRLLCMLRDPRKGMGERSLFRAILTQLIKERKVDVKGVVEVILEHGRFDDLVALEDATKHKDLWFAIKTQFKNDLYNLKNNKPVSLLAKWMPSVNTASEYSRKVANRYVKMLGLDAKKYRKCMSALRKSLRVTETDVCAKTFENIEYSHVPSLAMKAHAKTFEKFDEVRFTEYLTALKKGKTKVNANTISVPQLMAQYRGGKDYDGCFNDENTNTLLNEQYKALPKREVEKNLLPVCDVSGSMYTDVANNIKAIDVSLGLGVYISQHNRGAFKDLVMSFSEHSNIVNLSGIESFTDRVDTLEKKIDMGYNTNVESAFDRLLETAIKTHCPQEDLPDLLFISDMEFDYARSDRTSTRTLMDTMAKKYEDHGYKLPKLIFWNTCNRSNTVLMKENEKGLILMSGFSQNLVEMLNSNELNPWSALVETLCKSDWVLGEKMFKKPLTN